MYGHSPFGAASVARRGKPAWGPSHILALPHTSPSKHSVLETSTPIVSLWLACSFIAFGSLRIPFGAWRFCAQLHPEKTGKISNSKNNRSRCRRQSLAQLTPRYGLVRRCRCRRRPPSSSCAIHQCAVLLYPVPAVTSHQDPATGGSHTLCEACHVVP